MRIVYFAPIPYDGMKQRPQYLADELAREHEVLYVDPTVSMMKSLLKGGQSPKGYCYEAGNRLTVLRLSGVLSVHRSLEGIWSGFCFFERLQLRRWLRQADAIWIGHAPWYDVVKRFQGVVIYDKMDEDVLITRNKLMRRLICRVEPALIARADCIFVTAKQFLEKISEIGKRPVLVPNAVQREQAMASTQPAKNWRKGTRVFGYVGMISHWFDMEVVLTILKEDSRNHVVLVGPVEIPKVEHERLQYVGYVPKEEVGSWVEAFDVCLYPFLRSELLDTIDPVKIYEYLAANKPVLAAKSIETEKFGTRIIQYRNTEELTMVLHTQKFQKPFPEEGERRRFVLENDWEARGEIVRKELEAVSDHDE